MKRTFNNWHFSIEERVEYIFLCYSYF